MHTRGEKGKKVPILPLLRCRDFLPDPHNSNSSRLAARENESGHFFQSSPFFLIPYRNRKRGFFSLVRQTAARLLSTAAGAQSLSLETLAPFWR